MYTGAKAASQYTVGASFNHTEDYSKLILTNGFAFKYLECLTVQSYIISMAYI